MIAGNKTGKKVLITIFSIFAVLLLATRAFSVIVNNFNVFTSTMLGELLKNAFIQTINPFFVKEFMSKVIIDLESVLGINLPHVYVSSEFLKIEKNSIDKVNTTYRDFAHFFKNVDWKCIVAPHLEGCQKSVYPFVLQPTYANPQSVASYVAFIVGDVQLVDKYYEAFSKVKDVSEDYRSGIDLKVGEFKALNKNIANTIMWDYGELEKAREYRKLIKTEDKRISQVQNYTSDQAMKDLLKAQIQHTRFLIELVKSEVERQMRDISVKNADLANVRADLIGEMHPVVSFEKVSKKVSNSAK